MEFLENALEKTKDFINVAYKKTGEAVNTEKQKFDVASIKSKQDKDFSALGRICFEMFKNDENATDEVKALVDAIKEKDKKIEQINAEILAAKNRKTCPECGASIDKNATFCSACGVKLVIDNGESEDE